ncbi:MAG: hypothetical protein QW117_01870 [Candidatus Pacearchaeota archaeon]
MKKRGLEFNFAVLFSIIVGIAILLLAVYFSMKIISIGSLEQESSKTTQLLILFDPMETGISSGKYELYSLKEDSKIYNECFNDNEFGYQKFSLSSKILGKWQEKNIGQRIYNKYIFSSQVEEGKKIHFFSKPFNFPFKVSELIFISTENYCFYNTPDFIKEEIEVMKIKNIKLNNCSSSDIKVCFYSGVNCNITVIPLCQIDCEYGNYEYGKVKHSNGKEVYYYGDSLLYGAIFSSPEIYECNFKRLMYRASQQAKLLSEESYFISTKCQTIPKEELFLFSEDFFNIKNSSELSINIINKMKNINKKNEIALCNLW